MYWKPTEFDDLDEATAEEAERYRAHVDDESRAVYTAIAGRLPTDFMYGLSAHSVPIVRDVLDIVKPAHLVEIGFGAGVSSSLFLTFGKKLRRLVSIDYSTVPEVLAAAGEMQTYWSPRFRFLPADSRRVAPARVLAALRYAVPDLMFIDGGHDYETVATDLGLARGLAPPWILLDDWWAIFGPGVQPAWAEFNAAREYELAEQWGNVILFRRAPGRKSYA